MTLTTLRKSDPQTCEGCSRQIERILRRADQEPLVAERVTSIDLMMALVAAGFALSLVGASQISGNHEPGVVARPLAGRMPMLTTYLLRLDHELTEPLPRFIERVHDLEESAATKIPTEPTDPNVPEE